MQPAAGLPVALPLDLSTLSHAIGVPSERGMGLVFFFIYVYINLFIFGCIGSLLLHAGFL